MDQTIEKIRKIRAMVRNLSLQSDRERTKSFKEIIALLDDLQSHIVKEKDAKTNT